MEATAECVAASGRGRMHALDARPRTQCYLSFMRFFLFLLLCCGGCGDDPVRTQPLAGADAGDVPSDGNPSPDTAELADGADTADSDGDGGDVPDVPRPMAGEIVRVDLAPFLQPGQSVPRIFQATDADLLTGEVAAGQLGDWVLENDHARFVVQAGRRAMGPCPYGGTIVDSALRTPDGFAPDVTGETCLLINAGRTLRPQSFEVLSTSAGPVLAVTGDLAIHDFVAIESQARDLLRGLELEIPLDPNAPIPATATVYYVLAADAPELTVVTALRNDADAEMHLAVGHVIDTGGDVAYFNPLSTRKGFGYQPVSDGVFRADPLPFLAFAGAQSSYAFVPEVDPMLSEVSPIPTGGSYLTIVGLALAMHRLGDILPVLLANPQAIENWPGLLHLGPGEVDRVVYTHVQGTGSVSSLIDRVYRQRLPETGTLEGVVVSEEPDANERVSVVAVRDRRAWNHAIADAEGAFSMTLPPGDYEVRAHNGTSLAMANVTVPAGGRTPVVLGLGQTGGIRVAVSRPDGTPTPAKVVVLCDPGPCERPLSSLDADVDTDALPHPDIARIAYAGADGAATVPLEDGSYRVVVSRGLSSSVWPPNANSDGGFPVLVASDWLDLNAEIARVVHPAGWVTADLHVHGVRSLDSSVGHHARVLGHAAAGVDVLVSTDHDVVTDFGPTVAALGLEDEISTVVGEEVTTANYGHYNGFPVAYDPISPNGGALDWGGAGGHGKSPAEIFSWFRDQPGEQVIQVNHPEASGLITALRADPLRGTSLADPESFRLAPTIADPETGDTGLWTDTFTAFELLNSYRMSRFWERFRWWLQMLGRGFTPTGTGVTDTHRLYKTESESPHTWVRIGPDTDTPGSFDEEAFAVALNQGAAVGTSGPFVDVVVRAGQGRTAGLGETVRAASDSVTAVITVRAPAWMDVDTVEIYTNVTSGIETEPGVPDSTAVAPSYSLLLPWGPDREEIVEEGSRAHRAKESTVEVTIPVDGDAYLVVLVRSVGPNARTMFPIVHDRGARAFAFTNPIYIDADGNGFDHPPLPQP